MDNEVVREDSDSTQRRTWTAAEAAAHPALGSGSTDSLSRMPRGSQAPTPASSETVVTPAPQFDGSGERLDASELVVSSESDDLDGGLDGGLADDLDGIVELSSTMLVEDSESSEIEMLSDDLVEEDLAEEDLPNSEAMEGFALLEADDIVEEDVIEEVDSDLLSFVEARGEIDEKPQQRAPSPIEVSSVSLSALHETLHNQAVDSGMATYSTGVPIHSLDRDSNTGKTLQIVRPEAVEGFFTIRNILMGTVFLAGIGAGIYFGLPTSSSSAAKPAASTAAMVIPADASESQQAVASAAVGLPVVAPLVESTQDPEAGNDPALALAEATDTEAAEPPAVAPLESPAGESPAFESPAVAPSEEPSEVVAPPSNIDVQPLDVEAVVAAAPETEVIAPVTRKASRRARSSDVDDIAPKSFGSGDPGVLMLGAKPPCDIFIDGKKTGLKTPQRVLRLPPGKHKITLINQEHKLRDSFRVSIQSGKKTRIVRDMTSKIQ